ncbi:hypothetical protein VTK73DRAFT_9608 [Phialemonium thermophilum]|uniref:Uncharacterized protein n=1 Tax=Phialemonium thermophilum TaxID=223376 RepID=A0ABR3W1I4_9PEZI
MMLLVPLVSLFALLSHAGKLDGLDRPCGFRIAPCPTGQTCSSIDTACTRGQNCQGVCRDAGAATASRTTSKITTATTTTTTITTACSGSTTPTVTATYQSCGGHRVNPRPCPENHICIDDPRREGSCGMACDMPGICVEPTTFCGGFAGVACESGKVCVDDPRDRCDPENGGADCGGFCV